MFKPYPTPNDKKLLHSVADRIWEWCKQIEDENTKNRMKEISSNLHYLAEGPHTTTYTEKDPNASWSLPK